MKQPNVPASSLLSLWEAFWDTPTVLVRPSRLKRRCIHLLWRRWRAVRGAWQAIDRAFVSDWNAINRMMNRLMWFMVGVIVPGLIGYHAAVYLGWGR